MAGSRAARWARRNPGQAATVAAGAAQLWKALLLLATAVLVVRRVLTGLVTLLVVSGVVFAATQVILKALGTQDPPVRT